MPLLKTRKQREYTVIKSVVDTTWVGPGNLLKSTDVIQSDPHRLEEWGNKNMMKFNKDKTKCLQLKKKKST